MSSCGINDYIFIRLWINNILSIVLANVRKGKDMSYQGEHQTPQGTINCLTHRVNDYPCCLNSPPLLSRGVHFLSCGFSYLQKGFVLSPMKILYSCNIHFADLRAFLVYFCVCYNVPNLCSFLTFWVYYRFNVFFGIILRSLYVAMQGCVLC